MDHNGSKALEILQHKLIKHPFPIHRPKTQTNTSTTNNYIITMIFDIEYRNNSSPQDPQKHSVSTRVDDDIDSFCYHHTTLSPGAWLYREKWLPSTLIYSTNEGFPEVGREKITTVISSYSIQFVNYDSNIPRVSAEYNQCAFLTRDSSSSNSIYDGIWFGRRWGG